jgi:hypothetical protein
MQPGDLINGPDPSPRRCHTLPTGGVSKTVVQTPGAFWDGMNIHWREELLDSGGVHLQTTGSEKS